MNRLNKTEITVFISLMWSLLPSKLTNQNLLSLVKFNVPVSKISVERLFVNSAGFLPNMRCKADFRPAESSSEAEAPGLPFTIYLACRDGQRPSIY